MDGIRIRIRIETMEVYVRTSESFFLTAVAGDDDCFPLETATSPNRVTAALTDWKGALVSTSPTSVFGESEEAFLRTLVILIPSACNTYISIDHQTQFTTLKCTCLDAKMKMLLLFGHQGGSGCHVNKMQ